MNDEDRDMMLREALRKGIPLHRIEAYLDLLDQTAKQPVPTKKEEPRPDRRPILRPEIS